MAPAYDGRVWESILGTGSEDEDFRDRLREVRGAVGIAAIQTLSMCLSGGSEEGYFHTRRDIHVCKLGGQARDSTLKHDFETTVAKGALKKHVSNRVGCVERHPASHYDSEETGVK